MAILSATDNDMARLFIKAPEGHWWRHRYGDEPFYPQNIAPNVRAVAFVNDSRWVVACPFDCNGAQLASKEFRRFFCVDCLNAEADGQWVEVAWPADDFVVDVERLLEVRPDPRTRRWWPNESLGVLVAENMEHGLFDPATGEVKGDPGSDRHLVLAYEGIDVLSAGAPSAISSGGGD